MGYTTVWSVTGVFNISKCRFQAFSRLCIRVMGLPIPCVELSTGNATPFTQVSVILQYQDGCKMFVLIVVSPGSQPRELAFLRRTQSAIWSRAQSGSPTLRAATRIRGCSQPSVASELGSMSAVSSGRYHPSTIIRFDRAICLSAREYSHQRRRPN